MTGIIEVRVIGPRRPDDVHVSDALQFLAGLEKAAKACSTEEHAGMAIVRVRNGSARYSLRSIALGSTATGMITLALASGSYDHLPGDARAGLREAISVNKRMGWTTEIRWDEEDELPAVTITGETVIPEESAVSACETAVYGVVELVGGKAPAIIVRTDSGERARCPVTAEQARSLAGRLYQPVRITGNAVYRTEDLKIEKFETGEIEPFEEVSFASSMGELRGAMAGGWREMSINDMLYDLRGDDE